MNPLGGGHGDTEVRCQRSDVRCQRSQIRRQR
jgi:hypothetical protein